MQAGCSHAITVVHCVVINGELCHWIGLIFGSETNWIMKLNTASIKYWDL
jgi:hypothetical protein